MRERDTILHALECKEKERGKDVGLIFGTGLAGAVGWYSISCALSGKESWEPGGASGCETREGGNPSDRSPGKARRQGRQEPCLRSNSPPWCVRRVPCLI